MSKLIEKTDEGKIKYYTIDGKLIYPSINNPNFKFNSDGVWETFLIPDNPEDLEMAKKMGVRTKGWEDKEIPESIYFKRFTKNKNGADNKSVIIKNAEGGPFEFNDESGREITIGNQTHAKNLLGATARVGHCVMVRFKQYYSYGTGNGTGYSYRGLYYVFKIVSLNANGVVNQWTNQSSGFR